MKTYKWFFPVLAAVVLMACKGESEEELVGNWTRQGDFAGPARTYAAYFTIGNKGYVCCGYNSYKTRLSDMWEFDNDPSSPNPGWKQMTKFPGGGRQQAVGFGANGKGYVGTGWYVDGDNEDQVMNDFWEFDPTGTTTNDDGTVTQGSWKEIAKFPGTARHSAVAFTLKDANEKEYGYVGTGYTGDNSQEKLILKDIWRYDPANDTWTQIPDYNGSKRYAATAFVIDNKAYLCTGRSSSGSAVVDFWMYDPISNTWTEKRKMINANQDEDYDDDYADLNRYGAVSFVMPGEGGEIRGYIALGLSKSSVWEYDPIKDLWVQRTYYYSSTYQSSREGAVAFSFTNLGRGLVGMGSSGVYYDDIREFFPTEEDNVYDDY